MRLGEPGKMQAAINITPLVDVVLVLLIIFMVMAPQMRKGPDVNLPNTAKPAEQGDERGRILVSIDEAGGLWINDKHVAPEHFGEALRAAVGDETDPKVVIRGDAKLNFREVRQAMLAIEQAGFRGVGLIAKRAGAEGEGRLTIMQLNRGDSRLQSAVRDQHHAARRRGARAADHLHGRRSPPLAGLRRRHPSSVRRCRCPRRPRNRS